ncbi:hypothetical protein QAD02_016447 [Eretmocerus hayati]|uniref:Uncharacterized protein n=1 Tax=Eretmocerus hayati TaxID=131215 RepID=A0ACC2PB75_9HYME|nr:hypothetical protein QAD02_016447 [Eretmocerus hayati]
MEILRRLEQQNENIERLRAQMGRGFPLPNHYFPFESHVVPNADEPVVPHFEDRRRLELERIRLLDEIQRLRQNPAVRHCLENDCGSEFAKPLLFLRERKRVPCPRHKLCERPVEFDRSVPFVVNPRMLRANAEAVEQNQCNMMFEMEREVERISEELRQMPGGQRGWLRDNFDGSS